MARRSKSLFESKTFWANVIGAAVAILTMVAVAPDLGLTKTHVALLMVVSNALNIALRYVTTQPITPVAGDAPPAGPA